MDQLDLEIVNVETVVVLRVPDGGIERLAHEADLEQNKVLGNLIYVANVVKIDGTYDEVNRLCAEVGDKYGWAFANINLRPFYGDGSKSYGYEIAEQLGWQAPDHVVVPIASGSLLTKITKGFAELQRVGLIDEKHVRVSGAQAAGCNPVANAFERGWDAVKPVQKPDSGA